jgi:hypothetical protein
LSAEKEKNNRKVRLNNCHMSRNHSTGKKLRSEILQETKRFLAGLESGASDEVLSSVLLSIKLKENELIQKGGLMLAPEIWQFLHNRLANRRSKDFSK